MSFVVGSYSIAPASQVELALERAWAASDTLRCIGAITLLTDRARAFALMSLPH